MTRHRSAAALSAAALAALFLGAIETASAQEGTVGRWIKTATSPGRPSGRIEAIGHLGSVSDPRVIEEWKLVKVLLKLAGNPNPRIAVAAVSGLGNYARRVQRAISERIVGPLLDLAREKEGHSVARQAAIGELGRTLDAEQFPHQGAIGKLVSLAGNTREEPDVRGEAYLALGEIGSVKAKEVIRKGLSDKDIEVAGPAFEALRMCLGGPKGEEFADPRTMGVLMQRLRSPKTSKEMKMSIFEIIGLFVAHGYKGPGAERPLIDSLNQEEDVELVIAALHAISYVGSAKVVDPIVSAYARFRDKDDAEGKAGGVRVEVCATAGAIFDLWSQRKSEKKTPLPTAAARTLTGLLCKTLQEDPSSDVRREAAFSLGNLYDKGYDKRAAVKTLIVVLSHEGVGDEIKNSARNSLKMLTGRDYDDPKRWEDWYKKNESKLVPRRR